VVLGGAPAAWLLGALLAAGLLRSSRRR
jgi:uncharacterized membrane protein AbrB (regulator of aidB expression)